MHITGNPPEKKPWLQHQLYRPTKTILREREREEDCRIQFTRLCHSLPVKIHKLAPFSPETSSPSLVFLSLSACTALQLQGVFNWLWSRASPSPSRYPNPKIQIAKFVIAIICNNPLNLVYSDSENNFRKTCCLSFVVIISSPNPPNCVHFHFIWAAAYSMCLCLCAGPVLIYQTVLRFMTSKAKQLLQ